MTVEVASLGSLPHTGQRTVSAKGKVAAREAPGALTAAHAAAGTQVVTQTR